jgi:hypothetical protein
MFCRSCRRYRQTRRGRPKVSSVLPKRARSYPTLNALTRVRKKSEGDDCHQAPEEIRRAGDGRVDPGESEISDSASQTIGQEHNLESYPRREQNSEASPVTAGGRERSAKTNYLARPERSK